MAGIVAAKGPSMVPVGSQCGGNLSMWGYFARAMTSRYATFSGRARRKEYWAFALFWIIVLVQFAIVALASGDGASGADDAEPSAAAVIASLALGLFAVASFIPILAVTVRRLHDLGMSGWWLLLLLIPGAGSVASIIIGLIPGQPGDNRFGASPIGR